MHHGSSNDFQKFRANRNTSGPIDQAVGVHFAADPVVAQNFRDWEEGRVGGGGRAGTPQKGYLYRAKAPTRSQVFKIGGRGSDQANIGAHIIGTVFQHHPDMFRDWIKYARHVDDATADEVHAHLSRGEAPHHERFGTGRTNANSFKSYVRNFDSTLIMQPRPGFKAEVVDKYLEHMKGKGYKGLIYRNTSPTETIGARSRKSYIIFHPEDIEGMEKV